MLPDNNEIGPETLITFSLRNFDNIYFDFEIHKIAFATMFALAVLQLRYSYLNNLGSPSAYVSLISMIKPKITPKRCLLVMWAVCSYKQFFDLDLLRLIHDSGKDPIDKEGGYDFVLEFKNLKIGTPIPYPYVFDWLPLFL